MLSRNMRKMLFTSLFAALLIITGCGEEGAEQASGAGGEDDGTSNYSEEMNYTITGVEPGAGQTETNNIAIEEYDSLSGWEQETSSTAAMLTALDNAIENEEPIIVTAWSPHYKFAKHDLKFLEDPEGIFGEEEEITTIAREGLEEDLPEGYTILDQIEIDISEVESALLASEESNYDFENIAAEWVEDHQDIVKDWTAGAEPVNGDAIEIVTTQWDDALFIANIATKVLSDHGFDVTLTPVDPAVLFEAIATGNADASLSPWLHATHGAYYDEYSDQFEDLGPNSYGAKIGLAVPTYMEIDSIEDLEPRE